MANATVDTLADDIMNALGDYRDDIDEKMQVEIKKLAKTTCDEMKNDSKIPERTGDYKKSFYVKKGKSGRGYVKYVLANKKYQLTHLLENGHLVKGGAGRTTAYPHWKPAEERVDKAMDSIVKRIMG